MKRLKYVLALVVLLLLSLSVSASAHQGNTDGNGGHTDSRTGEYHYHHGYPAHDHEDLDGDGIPDCPYEFDDKTKHNDSYTGSSSNNEDGGTNSPAVIEKEETSSGLGVAEIIFLVIFGLPFVIYLPIIGYEMYADISTRSKKRKQAKEETAKDKELCIAKYEGKTKAEIMNAPQGCTIGEDDLPSTIFHFGNKWGKFSFFITEKSGKRYHSRKGCCGANKEINAYRVPHGLTPCTKCKPVRPDMEWVTEYKRAMEKIKKYKIQLKE